MCLVSDCYALSALGVYYFGSLGLRPRHILNRAFCAAAVDNPQPPTFNPPPFRTAWAGSERQDPDRSALSPEKRGQACRLVVDKGWLPPTGAIAHGNKPN